MQNVWKVIADSFPVLMYRGLTMTIPLTLISFAIALVIAIIVALVQFSKIPVLREICRFYIWVIRGTPLLVQLYVIFFGLPSVGVNVEAFPAAVLVFSINEGAYAAETIRGALESVPAGQMEAGRCVGMNYGQIMWHVIMPQTFRTAFPALGNELISMVKDTSLAANITVTEMFFQAQRIAGRTYQTMALYLEVAVIYLLFSTLISLLQRFGEKKLGAYGRQ
ncbi:MAG: amino acid ABC transporter permease [Lachnospiraceae bacterium]|uniref:Amino acid ABC transporter permease n=1 Tax=Candidatus Weimeria bifida TaxID=2599074 RepID=A0A6N7IZH4_9FIRM|nr:amino acid ABC transporter permease [Candidatus Weimeria bifida]RRF96588.1 MAG: amino acid ABC transporter permease [Lachnospiraceae bacterium]